MMDIIFFKTSIEPMLDGYSFKYSSFSSGDFGALERVEFEGYNKVGTVDFWSQGFIGIDVYDLILDEQQLNILLCPQDEKFKTIDMLMDLLINSKVV